MSITKKLFLFAGFDKQGIIDDALVYYVQTLSKHGDIIVCFDCNCSKSEIDKLKPYTIHQIVGRHEEYDFGSYKRAFQYAYDKDILKNYDSLYLINDSVFGPMFDIKKILNTIEQNSADAVGIIKCEHKTHSYIESWFVRLNKKIFTSRWFQDFITSIKKQTSKISVTIQYEHGLTNVIKNNGCSWAGLYTVRGRKTYNTPKSLFLAGCPFVKKLSFTRHNGALGKQIKYILNHSDKKAVQSVMKTANRIYGKDYMIWFLTSNPIKIIYRNITYGLKKLKNGGI